MWPFGPGISEQRDSKNSAGNSSFVCPTYSKCWYGLLSCGNPNIKNIKSAALPFIRERLSAFISENHNLNRDIDTKLDIDGTMAMLDINNWSIKALNMHMRIVGAEIVTPDTRYYTMPGVVEKKELSVDVLISQFQLTIPNSISVLEVRHQELYPGALINYNDVEVEFGFRSLGHIYLGGTEGRCQGYQVCPTQSNCCECDKRSFVTTTPIKIKVPDGSKRCTKINSNGKISVNSMENVVRDLPICKGTYSSYAGRWINGEFSSGKTNNNCKGSGTHSILNNIVINQNIITKSSPNNLKSVTNKANSEKNQRNKNSNNAMSRAIAKPSNSNTKKGKIYQPASRSYESARNNIIVNERIQRHIDSRRLADDGATLNNQSTFRHAYASGDPCLINANVLSLSAEENAVQHYYYAPYQCKYHFYTRKEVDRCFLEENITHIHMQGDSMSRDLFSTVINYFGNTNLTSERLKHMTNGLGQKSIQYNTRTLQLSQGKHFTQQALHLKSTTLRM